MQQKGLQPAPLALFCWNHTANMGMPMPVTSMPARKVPTFNLYACTAAGEGYAKPGCNPFGRMNACHTHPCMQVILQSYWHAGAIHTGGGGWCRRGKQRLSPGGQLAIPASNSLAVGHVLEVEIVGPVLIVVVVSPHHD